MQLRPVQKATARSGLLSNPRADRALPLAERYRWDSNPGSPVYKTGALDQLSHGASLVWNVCMVCYPSKAAEGWVVFKSPCSASAAAQGHTSGQPKAPLGFKPRISCLLDRRFNQLSHGANLQAQSPGGRLRGSKHPETRPTARHCTA